MYSGLRLAGPVEDAAWVGQFARHLGVAFQILNDLNDWQGDNHNKLLAGGDVLGGRPTVLWALALEALNEQDRAELETLAAADTVNEQSILRIRQLYQSAGVFEKATRLVDKYQERAEAVADEVQGEELRRLLYYLVDTVLERTAEAAPPVIMPTLPAVSAPAAAP